MSTEVPPDFLQGVIAPMLTSVHADRSLDLTGAKALVGWLASRNCVRSLFVRSGMGKMFTFTVAETKAFGQTIMDTADGRFGILLNASGEWLTRDADRARKPDSARYTADAVELTHFAHRIGADAAVHVMPEALTPARGETLDDTIFRYFQVVHDAAAIPLVIYNPPGLVPGYQITPELLQRLLVLPRVAGLKLSTDDGTYFGMIADAVRGRRGFALICGNEAYCLRALDQGASGVIGEGCNVYPEILYALRAHFMAGRMVEAVRMQRAVLQALAAKRALEGRLAGLGPNARLAARREAYVGGQVAWKQVLIRRGVRIEPYDRSPHDLYPKEPIGELDAEVRALVKAAKVSLAAA